jgi:hypothetical protein
MLVSTDDVNVISSDILELHKGDTGSVYYKGNTGFIVARGDIMPATTNTYSLGSTGFVWKSVHVGPGTIYIQDSTNTSLSAELTMGDGVFKISNAATCHVGNLAFIGNSIESKDVGTEITLGQTGSSGEFHINRNVVMNKTSITNLGDLGCTGQATFEKSPHVPEPTQPNDAVSKGYVDSTRGLGITGPTGNILYSLGATGYTFSHYGLSYPNSMSLTIPPSAITELPEWNTLATTYMIFIDHSTSPSGSNNLDDPFRELHFKNLSASSGSEYQTVVIINCSDRHWTVVTTTAIIYGNSTTVTARYTIPSAPATSKSNCITFRSMLNGTTYQWIVH